MQIVLIFGVKTYWDVNHLWKYELNTEHYEEWTLHEIHVKTEAFTQIYLTS